MKQVLDDGRVKLIPSDWRYSSAILGLRRFHECLNITDYEMTSEYLVYNPINVTEENMAIFIDKWYGNFLNYNKALSIIEMNTEYNDEQIKEVNELLNKNIIIKNVFKGNKFDGTNGQKIVSMINENKKDFTLNLFINSLSMYRKYCNQSAFLQEDVNMCRLCGYYENYRLKTKQLSWNFDKESFVYEDCKEFDFVPFAFTYGYDSCFLNLNYDLFELEKENDILLEMSKEYFNRADNSAVYICKITDLIEYNCEVIFNGSDDDNNYYKTIFFSKEIISLINEAKNDIEALGHVNINNEWIDLKAIAYNNVLNNTILDSLIVRLFKEDKFDYYIKRLININLIILRRYNTMKDSIKSAYASAKRINEVFSNKKNQLNSFKQKLISSLSYDDKDSVFNILTKLSDVSGVHISFIYDILENYEDNKSLVYTFVNTLNNYNKDEKENSNE